jgi:hypothetical protein
MKRKVIQKSKEKVVAQNINFGTHIIVKFNSLDMVTFFSLWSLVIFLKSCMLLGSLFTAPFFYKSIIS